MPDGPPKPFNPQDIYPQAQEKSGMAAKKPTVFNVPLIRVTLLLFLPVYLMTALSTLYMSNDRMTQADLAIGSIALFMTILLVILLGIVLLAYARMIIVRNCSHPLVIELLYVCLVVPVGYLLTRYSLVWFHGVPLHLVAIQAIVLLSLTFGLTLVARASSRG